MQPRSLEEISWNNPHGDTMKRHAVYWFDVEALVALLKPLLPHDVTIVRTVHSDARDAVGVVLSSAAFPITARNHEPYILNSELFEGKGPS